MNKETEQQILSDWNSKIISLMNDKKYDDVLEITYKLIKEKSEDILNSELGFHLLKAMVVVNQKNENLDEALKWGKEWDKFDYITTGRPDSGEKDFYLGKINFEAGNKNVSLTYFETADKKSKGRCFGLPEGNKYKKIYKEMKSKL